MRKSFTWICAALFAAALAAPAHADITRLPPNVAAAIAAMGPKLTPAIIARTIALMTPLVAAAPLSDIAVIRGVHYGGDPLQTIDIYRPKEGAGMPIVLFVHGGGFVRGDKNSYGRFYGNIPSYFAQHGMVGVNADYRLAPKATWPAGSEDVGTAIAFMQRYAARYGGDASRIFVIGHSAGANLVASYVLDPAIYPKTGPGVAGAVLISGPAYRAASVSQEDRVYLGASAAQYARHAPAALVAASKLPLMIVTAEFDPVALAPESYDLAARVCVRDGKCPRFLYLKGHNHISEVASIGSPDDELGRAIADFVRTTR